MPPRLTSDDRRKLKAEADLAELQVKEHGKQNGWEVTKNIATFLTTLIALFGLFFSISQQRQQAKDQALQRIDDQFNKDLQQLESSTNEQSKLISINKLGTYFRPIYDTTYQEQLTSVLINYARLDSSSAVLLQIRKLLVTYPSRTAINLLAEQNRTIQEELRNVGRNEIEFFPDTAIKPLSINVHLDWNFATLIQCINKMGGIDGADLSHLIFSRNTASVLDLGSSSDPTPKTTYLDNLHRFAIGSRPNVLKKGLHFRFVNFSGSFLNSLWFTSDTLENVRFDGCNLIGTRFYNCQFIDNSFNDFVPVANFYFPGTGIIFMIDEAPKWENCSGNFIAFRPKPDFSSGSPQYPIKQIMDSLIYIVNSKIAITPHKGRSSSK